MHAAYGPDGSIEIAASRFHFFCAAVMSAAIGALIGYMFERTMGTSWLSYSVMTVFGFWTVRALIQATFVPQLLTFTFGPNYIEGPKWWWLFRERIELSQIDWESFTIIAGRLSVLSSDGRQIFTRYGDEGGHAIQEHLQRLRDAARTSAA